jgi:anti-sigma factor RsiW
VVGRSPVPTLVCRHRLHLISLTAAPAAGRADKPPVRLAIGGYNLVHWIEGGVSYWAVSDVAVAELESFAQIFRTTPPDR